MESYYARIVIVGITKQMVTRTETRNEIKGERRNEYIIVSASFKRGDIENVFI